MRIGLDVSALDPNFKAHAGRGIGRYVSNLYSFFAGVTPSRFSVGTFDHSWFELPSLLERGVSALPYGRQTVRQQLCYPLQLVGKRMRHFDLLHFPAHMDAPSWTRKPYLITVLDLIPLKLANLYEPDRPGWRFRLARSLEIHAIQGAAHILAISECTKRDIVDLLSIPAERISVVPLGVDERFYARPSAVEVADFRIREGIPRDDPVFLYMGGIDQRKNISCLLSLHREVIDRRRGAAKSVPTLLIAGKIASDRQYPRLLAEIKRLRLENNVKLLGYVVDDDLGALFASCSVFLFPSLYEGFGLPPLEAQAAGLPVVSSSTSSLPEVLGKSALYFSPSDPSEGAARVLDLLECDELAATLRDAGKANAKRFTWSATGEQTLEVYESVAFRRAA